MLTYFKVQGFKKFEHEIVMRFDDVRDYQFSKECIKDNTIKNAVIYGRNASGKTSLGLAILDIIHHMNDNVNVVRSDNYLSWNNGVAEFEYRFKFNEDIVKYTYSKVDITKLTKEEIMINDKLWLRYEYDSATGEFDGFKDIAPTLNYEYEGEGSILRYILNNISIDKDSTIYKFRQFISNMLWARTLDKTQFIAKKNVNDDYYSFIFEPGMKEEFQEFLVKAGIKEKLAVGINEEKKKVLCFQKDNIPLSFFSVASSGTRALYTFFYWYKTSNDSSFIYLDEFDAYYHFELSEVITEMIKKMKDTQVVITTHNTNLLTNSIMRPDCYFVLSDKLVSACNATKRELREGHNLEKLYVAGEFNVN